MQTDFQTRPSEILPEAREFAAEAFRQTGRADLASAVLSGRGDDFAEVLSANAALRAFAARIESYSAALALYADPGFWDEDLPGGPLARHDNGDIARNALAGRPPFYHRD